MRHIKNADDYVATYFAEKEKNPDYTIEQWCKDYDHPPIDADINTELTPVQWEKLYEEPIDLWQKLGVELG